MEPGGGKHRISGAVQQGPLLKKKTTETLLFSQGLGFLNLAPFLSPPMLTHPFIHISN